MAEALNYTPRPKTPDEQLHEAQWDSSEALLEALKLMRELHDAGVLNTLVKLVRGSSGLLSATLNTLEGDSATRLLRNVVELGRTATEIDPATLGVVGRAATAGLTEGARRVRQGEGVGLGELLGLLRDRDVQLALGAVFGLLKGFGEGLRDARGETSETPGQRRPDEVLNKVKKGKNQG